MSYGNVENSSNRFITTALPLGAITTGGCIAARALVKENRADTFEKTAKQCAKAFTKENRETFMTFAKDILKKEKWAEYIGKISDKRLFAILAVGGAIGNAILFDGFAKLVNSYRDR